MKFFKNWLIKYLEIYLYFVKSVLLRATFSKCLQFLHFPTLVLVVLIGNSVDGKYFSQVEQ
jgi:hypothetical protein